MRTRRLALLFVVFLFRTSFVAAQSPGGTISGLVLDPSGAAIAGAEITIVNDATRVQYLTKTNDEGMYLAPNLPPGPYRIQVSKVGFKTIIKPDVILSVQDALAINFTLPIGATSVTVTVEGGAPIVDTTNGAVSTVVDRTYVENMPLNGRSFQDLILLAPGVVTATPQNSQVAIIGEAGEFSVNGQRTESNYYSVDGVSGNIGVAPGLEMVSGAAGPGGSLPAATALGSTQALVSVDALQEFRVQTSSYSAEYGRNPGGQFSFVTRSGTNRWHGTAFDYIRNSFFDANDWFNDYFGLAQPPLRQNDFGATLGGPIEIPGLYHGKDRTFFFVSYEGLRLVQPQAATVQYVPGSNLRQSAPAALQPVLNAFPAANGPDLGNGLAEFVGTWSDPSSIDAYSARFDHAVGNRLKLFFRFSDSPSSSESRVSTNAGMNSTAAFDARTYTFGTAIAVSSRVSDEMRLNYSSNETTLSTALGGFAGGAPVDLAELQGVGPVSDIFALFSIGAYLPLVTQFRESGLQRQWNLLDNLSLSVGRHQLKLGVDYRRLAPVATPYTPLIDYFYFGENSVLANLATSVFAESFVAAHPLYENLSVFGQDEWKLGTRLNLSLGLRWEVNPAPSVTQGLLPYTVEGSGPSTWTLAPQGTSLWKTTWFNFGPRLGIAYLLRTKPGWESVVRGGSGIFFDTGQQAGSQGFQGPGFAASAGYASQPFPMPAAQVTPVISNPPVSPYSAVYGYAPHLQLPYTFQWNATVDQALGKSQALTLSYVGSHGARLLEESEFSGKSVGNPNFGALILYRNGLTSDYNSLQLRFQRKLSLGLTALASYTWSHCLDYGSSDIQLGYARGNCNFDVRQSVSGAFSYGFPGLINKGFASALLSHWGLDGRFMARTGFPVTLNGTSLFDPTTGQLYYTGLNLVAGQPTYIYGPECTAVYNNGRGCPGGRALNPNAFSNTATGNLGNAPRNFALGFGAWQTDVAVRREFPLHENLKLQFRAEAFNVFNHPNFGFINPFFGQQTFGQANGTLASTLGVLSPLYQMGGPRSMQFACKLAF